MNHVNRNKTHNYFYIYGIQETEENLKKLEEVINNREFLIYRKLLYIIDNCQIVEEDSSGITIEIDILEHLKLLDDLANKFFTKKFSTRKVQKKFGRGYFIGNPFLTFKIYNGLRQIVFM